MRMLFKPYSWRCPKCGRVHKYKMTYFANEVWDKEVKRDNKQLKESEIELWRRA